MRTGTPDLDDAEELFSADVDGLLRGVALAGAQVRAIAEAEREGVLEPLADLRPRSVVIVYGGAGIAARAATLIVAAVSARIDVPIVTAPTLPGWIGPLDVVVIAGDDAGDMALADAAARGLRRRAEVVVVAPIAGPLRDALGGNGIDLSPRLDIEPRLRFVGFAAAFLAVLSGLRAVRFMPTAPPLDEVADALDAEASAGHPGRQSFHNRAKALALRVQGRPVVWSGDSPAATVVATHAAASFVALAGVICAAADLGDAAASVAVSGNDSGAASAVDSIFYDPEIDGPRAGMPTRVLVATTAAREWFTRRRVGGLADVELLIGDDTESGERRSESGAPEWASPPAPGEDVVADSPVNLMSFLILVLRMELAAVYLRLVGNTVR
ncbi:hypothetical protein QSJ18_02740 [Gordonia sp. ABSL1-1]|uniref:hypothetical protein n=1 Tax=Gordonia sp. ABSL1-1 TaxID=3053923 RepID=UPI00257391AF|nr:hypothetical protein [Gordonia sp. ABSL1-1]MDL9935653.1 hypothetical protein [Gordonia sp. ABSL1-1]